MNQRRPINRLVVLGLQEIFLQRVYDQLNALAGDLIQVSTLSLNDLVENPPAESDSVLYFSDGLRAIVEKIFPQIEHYIFARRESLIFNMRGLLTMEPGRRILVVNDMKITTEEATHDLRGLGIKHDFLPWYPDQPLPDNIDLVVTPGERDLVPPELLQKPLIDIGPRVVALETVFTLFDHFGIDYDPASLAKQYMRVMMLLPDTWSYEGADSFRRPYWFGIRRDTTAAFSFDQVIQKSPAMASFCNDLRKMALADNPIHIFGHTGTGKGRIAQAVHNASPFAEAPFVSINCAARTPETLERELFGWESEAGTFPSLFEIAEGGSLCIEEIGKLPPLLQVRLLQAVSEKTVARTGGRGVVDIRVRLITTASQRLDRMPSDSFDPELLLMITQNICRVPSLDERMADFEALVGDYIAKQLQKPHLTLQPDTLDILKAHTWEGNVQELYNVLQQVASMGGDTITPRHLPYYITTALTTSASSESPPTSQPAPPQPEPDFAPITQDLVTHGFIEEYREILSLYLTGKRQHQAYGRETVRSLLQTKGFTLSKQQLRLKLERLDKLGLLVVRPGRGGTTISERGERYLAHLFQSSTTE